VRARAGRLYARGMYIQGSSQYDYHVKTYGHPSAVRLQGHLPHLAAERWNPEN